MQILYLAGSDPELVFRGAVKIYTRGQIAEKRKLYKLVEVRSSLPSAYSIARLIYPKIPKFSVLPHNDIKFVV